jgi:hypothetical protein
MEERLCSSSGLASCKEKLAQLIRARAVYWKQRGKFRVVHEGDENTKFYHSHASHRLRKNQIKALEIDGVRCTRHVDKQKSLTIISQACWECQLPLFGTSILLKYTTLWLLIPPPRVASFSSSEALAAVKIMNFTSAPGPDGFVPGFYRLPWDFVEPMVMKFHASFHNGTTYLESINRAYVVLIPKTPDAVSHCWQDPDFALINASLFSCRCG